VLRRDINDRPGAVEVLVRLAMLNYQINDFTTARLYLSEAFKIARHMDNEVIQLVVILGFAWSRLYVGLPLVAACLLNVVTDHPMSPQSLSHMAQKMRFRLESELSPDEWAAAAGWSRSMQIMSILSDIDADLNPM
jgi:hypothetical protein